MNLRAATFTTRFLILLPITFILLWGCGGMSTNPGTSAQTTNLRVVDGNGEMPSVNVVVNGHNVVNNVTFLTTTGYVPVPAGSQQLTLDGWLDPPNPTAPENFTPGVNNTLVFEGCGTFGRSIFSVITDDTTPPAAGNFKLRVIDGGIFALGDIFVLPAGTAPSGTPTISGVSISSNNLSYFPFAAGSYHIVLTQFQTANIVLFDSGPIQFSSGQNRTFFLFQNGGPEPGQPGVFFCSNTDYKTLLVSDLN